MTIDTKKNQDNDGQPQMSVVVPVYNEIDNIPPLVNEIVNALEGRFAYEMVYVDDGSTDGTVKLLEEIGLGIPALRVVCHDGNFGQSAAMATGIKHARGRIIATLDGDGQNDPADIPNLAEVLIQAGEPAMDAILVVGRRRKRRDSWVRRVSSRLANGVRARLLKDNTPDTGSGLKVFTRRLFMDLPRFDHMHRFLPALVMRNNGTVMSIDVNHRERLRGKSKYGISNRLWVGIVDLIGVMWLQRRPNCPDIKKRLD